MTMKEKTRRDLWQSELFLELLESEESETGGPSISLTIAVWASALRESLKIGMEELSKHTSNCGWIRTEEIALNKGQRMKIVFNKSLGLK